MWSNPKLGFGAASKQGECKKSVTGRKDYGQRGREGGEEGGAVEKMYVWVVVRWCGSVW